MQRGGDRRMIQGQSKKANGYGMGTCHKYAGA